MDSRLLIVTAPVRQIGVTSVFSDNLVDYQGDPSSVLYFETWGDTYTFDEIPGTFEPPIIAVPQ